jgi:hypothetical protein
MALTCPALAQQRPLLTEDVDLIRPGVIRIEAGFEFLQDQEFSLSGLRGDLTKIADLKLSFGLSANVEFQAEWTIWKLLAIKGRQPSPIELKLGANQLDTGDVGDPTLWMKVKLRHQTQWAPGLGFKFGVKLPTSDQARGIGTNTTDFFAMAIAGKRLDKLNLFGNLGIGILQAPLSHFTQNDVLLYGIAGIYELSERLNLVGEVNGYHSSRRKAPLGTESQSEARLGAQLKALGLRWNVAGIFGLAGPSPKTGLSLGITYDWKAFKPIN